MNVNHANTPGMIANFSVREVYGRWISVVIREGRAYSCGHGHTRKGLAEA